MLQRLLILSLLATPVIGIAKATPAQKKKQKIEIKAVQFIGVEHVPVDELKEVLVNKKSSFFGLVSINGKYRPKELKGDAVHIRDVYYQHGYLDVQIGRPKVAINPATSEATVIYRVREGLAYKISGVHLVKHRGLDIAAISKQLKLKSGNTFNVATLREDIRTISTYVGDKGYAFAQVQPRFRKNSRNRTIDIAYFVRPGSRGVIRDIRIHGNTKTKDSVIRSYLSLAPGDPYKLSDLIDAQNALGRTGFFKSATIRPVRAHGNKVDLDINVKETKTRRIEPSAGYDSLEGFFVEGSFSGKNIMGSGIALGISGSWSKLKKNGTLFFDDPRVAGTMFGLYGGLYRTDTKDDQSHTFGFDKKELGGYLGVRRQFTHELSASIDYNYDDTRYKNVDTAQYPTRLKDYIKSSIGFSLTYNNTDDYYVPRRGIYAKGHIEYAGLGSGSNFAKYLKSSVKFAAYYGLQDQIGYDMILRYKMQGNYIHDMGFVPEAERLHIGGYYNGVRGYRSASIVPKGGTSGGLMSFTNSVEASIPLSEKNQVRLTGFADVGMIQNTSADRTVKKSIGAQIEWRSPLGDVNFVFAKAIGAKPSDKTSSFEFTIGKEF